MASTSPASEIRVSSLPSGATTASASASSREYGLFRFGRRPDVIGNQDFEFGHCVSPASVFRITSSGYCLQFI